MFESMAPCRITLWVRCVVRCVAVVRTIPRMTVPVLPGPLLRQRFSVEDTVRLMVVEILLPFSPAPARFLNRGLRIPIEIMVARFLWKLLLPTLNPSPESTFELLVHPPSAWASVWWKFARRALFLTAPTPPIQERMPLEKELPHRTVILIGMLPPLALRQTTRLTTGALCAVLRHRMNLPRFLLEQKPLRMHLLPLLPSCPLARPRRTFPPRNVSLCRWPVRTLHPHLAASAKTSLLGPKATAAFWLAYLLIILIREAGVFPSQSRWQTPLLWSRTLVTSRAESVPMYDMFMLRRLFEIPQSFPLNPLLVRSMASIILSVDPFLPLRQLAGTLWLPLCMATEPLLPTAMLTLA